MEKEEQLKKKGLKTKTGKQRKQHMKELLFTKEDIKTKLDANRDGYNTQMLDLNTKC
jgi:hypothetical protein